MHNLAKLVRVENHQNPTRLSLKSKGEFEQESSIDEMEEFEKNSP